MHGPVHDHDLELPLDGGRTTVHRPPGRLRRGRNFRRHRSSCHRHRTTVAACAPFVAIIVQIHPPDDCSRRTSLTAMSDSKAEARPIRRPRRDRVAVRCARPAPGRTLVGHPADLSPSRPNGGTVTALARTAAAAGRLLPRHRRLATGPGRIRACAPGVGAPRRDHPEGHSPGRGLRSAPAPRSDRGAARRRPRRSRRRRARRPASACHRRRAAPARGAPGADPAATLRPARRWRRRRRGRSRRHRDRRRRPGSARCSCAGSRWRSTPNGSTHSSRSWISCGSRCGLQPAGLSKFEAGLLALGQDIPGLPDLGPTDGQPRSTMGELAYAVLRRQLAVLRDKEPGTRLGEDIEELHDMRVATRRLRAGLALFADVLPVRAQTFREELGWLARRARVPCGISMCRSPASARWRSDGGPGRHRSSRPMATPWPSWPRCSTASGPKPAPTCWTPWIRCAGTDWPRVWPPWCSRVRPGAPCAHPGAGRHRACPSLVVPATRGGQGGAAGQAIRASSTDFHRLRIRCKRLRYSLEFSCDVYGGETSRFVRAADRAAGGARRSCKMPRWPRSAWPSWPPVTPTSRRHGLRHGWCGRTTPPRGRAAPAATCPRSSAGSRGRAWRDLARADGAPIGRGRGSPDPGTHHSRAVPCPPTDLPRTHAPPVSSHHPSAGPPHWGSSRSPRLPPRTGAPGLTALGPPPLTPGGMTPRRHP